VNRFWFVWNCAGRAPTIKHPSRTSANKEAERLALANPEHVFVVLESLGQYSTRRPVEWLKHEKVFDWPEEDVPC
jgi:hypothetical protein